MVGPWSSKCINKGVNTSHPNKALGGASWVKTDAFYFSPVPSTSVFADTTRSVRVAVGVRRAGSEWHGVAALATAQWPTKFKPSPQCEVPLCCHRPQSQAGGWEEVRGGGGPGGSGTRRAHQHCKAAVCSQAAGMLYRWLKSLYSNESICILVCYKGCWPLTHSKTGQQQKPPLQHVALTHLKITPQRTSVWIKTNKHGRERGCLRAEDGGFLQEVCSQNKSVSDHLVAKDMWIWKYLTYLYD